MFCSNLSLTTWICSDLDILSSGLKAQDSRRTFFNSTEWYRLLLARCFQALVMPENDCFILATIVLIQVLVTIAACLNFGVMNLKCQ